MLKAIFSKLLGAAARPASANPDKDQTSAEEIQHYYKEAIASSPFIKESGREAVLKDFLHEVKLMAGEPLSLEEKRALGVNTRLKITKELHDVLTSEGIEYGPKKALDSIYINATIDHSRRNALARMRSAGVKHYSLMSCGDGQDCEWCLSMNGTLFPIEVDFVRLSKENCKCDRCGCVLKAQIDF